MGFTSSSRTFKTPFDAVVELGGLEPDRVIATNTKESEQCDYINVGGKWIEVPQHEVYIAYRGNSDDVHALVCLVEKAPRGGVAVKVMSEFEGPYYYGAAKKVMDVLTGPDTAWRQRMKVRLLVITDLP